MCFLACEWVTLFTVSHFISWYMIVLVNLHYFDDPSPKYGKRPNLVDRWLIIMCELWVAIC